MNTTLPRTRRPRVDELAQPRGPKDLMKPEAITSELDTGTLLKTLIAFRDGDFAVRLPVDQVGVAGKIADTLNEILRLNQRMAGEFARISSAVGKEGRINQRVSLGSA